MKLQRLIGALCAGLMLLMLPARAAEQASFVTPTSGPMSMATFSGTYLNPALRALASCSWGASAPTNGPSGAALPYQCWADTTSNPVLFKTYDGASWVTYGSLNTSTHVWTPYRNGAAIVAVATSGSAADLTTGTLPAGRLPNPSVSSLGGVQSKTCSASQWLNEITTGGVPNCAQPNFTDLAGTASLAQLPAFSGMGSAAAAADTDTFPTNQGAGNLKQTLASVKTWIKAWIVKADVGLGNVDNTSDVAKWGATKTLTNTTYNCGSTGNVCTVRLATDITGFGTGVATALGVNIGSAGAPVLFNGAGGTPSSITLTNASGTAAGLTAGNVTTNANLTGEVTSVGNATTVTNASVIGKLLTAFSAGAGTVSSSDSILTAFQKIVGNIALKANAANPVFTGTEDNQGTLKLSSFVTATQITANQNNYTATDGSNTCTTKTTLRISTDASRNITGLSCGQAEGDLRLIHNVGSQNAVLLNEDSASTAANRFQIAGDIMLPANNSITIRYDGVSSRWRAITTPGAGGGGGGVTSVTIASGSGIAATGTCTITTSGTCLVSGFVSPPQGRLTLQSATPVMTSTQSAKTTIYYTPYVGNQVPIYDGASMVPTAFTEISVSTTDTTKNPSALGSSKVNDWFVWNDGGVLRLTHGPDWTNDTTPSAGTLLVLVNGIYLNNASITNGPAASRGTYVGTTRSNASSQLEWIVGGVGVNGSAAFLNVWNMYNRVNVSTFVGDSTGSWSYAVANTWRAANGSSTFRVNFVRGLDEEGVSAAYGALGVAGAATNMANAVGLDSTTTPAGAGAMSFNNITTNSVNMNASYQGLPGRGYHFLTGLEYNTTTTASSWNGSGAAYVQTGLTFNTRM